MKSEKKFPFGKYKNMNIDDVLSNTKYVIWLKENVPDTDLKFKWDIHNEVNNAYKKVIGSTGKVEEAEKRKEAETKLKLINYNDHITKEFQAKYVKTDSNGYIIFDLTEEQFQKVLHTLSE